MGCWKTQPSRQTACHEMAGWEEGRMVQEAGVPLACSLKSLFDTFWEIAQQTCICHLAHFWWHGRDPVELQTTAKMGADVIAHFRGVHQALGSSPLGTICD